MEAEDWKARGRSEKVAAMVREVAARAEAGGLSPFGDAELLASQLRAFGDEQWLDLQQATGNKRKKPPSPDTRSAVIAVFERRVDLEGEEEP